MANTFKDSNRSDRGKHTKTRRHQNRQERRQGAHQVRELMREHNAKAAGGRGGAR